MGLETLLEAAKYLEYKAEVEARGGKGYTELNGSSPPMMSPVPMSTEFVSHPRGINVPNGQHYGSSQSHSLPSFKSHLNGSAGLQRVVPEPVNGFKVELTYRRNSMRGSPEFDQFPGFSSNASRHRIAKSVSPNSISGLNNRNSGTREVHNKLEKNRRAHLKECFELLKSNLPSFEDRKISNLAILRSSLRHIQNLKRKEKDLEHEMERLARDKIALQQRLQLMKKDMAGQWDQLDWRGVSEPIEIEGLDCRRSPTSTDTTVALSPDRGFLDSRYSESSDSSSPTNNTSRSHASAHDMELDDSGSDSQQPLSLIVNNCHITKQKIAVNKGYGQVNGMNGISDKGPISLLTSNLSAASMSDRSTDKMAISPKETGTTAFLIAKNSGKLNGFNILESAMIATSNVNVAIGQYYEDICK